MLKIGIVLRYYPKTKIAIVQLVSDLFVGDNLRFVFEKYTIFEQKAEVIKDDFRNIESAKPKSVIGLVVNEEVKPGTEIFRG